MHIYCGAMEEGSFSTDGGTITAGLGDRVVAVVEGAPAIVVDGVVGASGPNSSSFKLKRHLICYDEYNLPNVFKNSSMSNKSPSSSILTGSSTELFIFVGSNPKCCAKVCKLIPRSSIS